VSSVARPQRAPGRVVRRLAVNTLDERFRYQLETGFEMVPRFIQRVLEVVKDVLLSSAASEPLGDNDVGKQRLELAVDCLRSGHLGASCRGMSAYHRATTYWRMRTGSRRPSRSLVVPLKRLVATPEGGCGDQETRSGRPPPRLPGSRSPHLLEGECRLAGNHGAVLGKWVPAAL
jgi:hypothetical protein